MTPTPDTHSTEAKARQLLDARIDSVRALVTTRRTLDDLRERIASAEGADVKAYRAALRDGWSPDELRKLGFEEPDKIQRVRRRAATAKHSARGTGPAAAGARLDTQAAS